MTKQKIELDFLEYLKDDLMVYQHYDTRIVSLSRAAQIYNLDKEEHLVHVEFLESNAVLWDIKRWRDSEERLGRQREASEKRRQQYFLDDENIKIVSRALAKKTGIKDAELLKPLAIEIIKKQQFDALPFLNLNELKVRVE